MSDTDAPKEAHPRPHLTSAPTENFWSKTLFFAKFEPLLTAACDEEAAEALMARHFSGRPSLEVARAVAERNGDTLAVRQHLVLVGAFTEFKQSEAIDAVAVAVLGEAVADEHRTPSKKIRRHAMMALLYEADPQHLLSVELWHRHLGRRRTHYRLKRPTPPPVDFTKVNVHEAASRVLAERKASGGREFRTFDDEIVVVPCADAGEVIVALREWPTRTTGRDRLGDVVTVDVPDWTVMLFSRGGHRLEVSDRQVDRGAHFANRLMRELGLAAAEYELVLDPLNSDKLDEFLDRLTDPEDEDFPLIEIITTTPWRPHQTITITGTTTHTAEQLVADLRELHPPFARDWRTVKQVKFRFEKKYKIPVHFPPADQPSAITFSDEGRGREVTKRLVEFLKHHLHVDVAPRARRGTKMPSSAKKTDPRRKSQRWWREALTPSTDAPAEWLEAALGELKSQNLVSTRWARAFPCNSPYLDRRAVGVDSLDCDGEVVLPFDLDQRDDTTQLEDDGEVECSAGLHRWQPMRFGLPTRVRVYVDVQHGPMFEHLAEELRHYGEVQGVPGRPGLLTVRLDDMVAHLVYVPLAVAEDLDPASHGRSRVAWVAGPCDRPARLPDDTLDLPDVLADFNLLAARWGTSAWKRRRSARPAVSVPPLAAEPPSTTFENGTVLLSLSDKGIHIGDAPTAIIGSRSRAMRVLTALHRAAAQDEGDGGYRQVWTWERLDQLLDDGERGGDARTWHTWVSRTRRAVDQKMGTPGIGEQAIPKTGSTSYRLGDGFVIVDKRLQAAATE